MCELDIAKALKTLRKEREMSQGDIFKSTGLATGYISKLENKKIIYPKIKTINKLAKAFNLSISEFLKYAENQRGEK